MLFRSKSVKCLGEDNDIQELRFAIRRDTMNYGPKEAKGVADALDHLVRSALASGDRDRFDKLSIVQSVYLNAVGE